MTMRVLHADSPRWAAIGSQLDELMASGDFRSVKENQRTRAGILRLDGDEVFVKRVENHSWQQRIADHVRGSRAKRTICGAAMLDRLGFAHARLLAAFELRRHGTVRASYVVSEALKRPRILSRFALAGGRNFARRQWIFGHLARELRRLHDSGLHTRDLQETNLMVEARGSALTIYYLDLEDFRRRRHVSEKLKLLNLSHLDRSIGRFVSRSRRLRFLYTYLGGKPERARARQLVAALDAIGRRKNHARHASVIHLSSRNAAAEISAN